MVIAVLFINLIVAAIIEATKHHPEENAHIRVVMQRHLGALLNEEQDQPVVIASLDSDSIQIRLEVIRVVRPLYSQLVKGDLVHLLHDLLATGIIIRMVQEIDAVSRQLRLHAHLLDHLDKRFHFEIYGFSLFFN